MSQITRRSFLEHTLYVAAAGLAADRGVRAAAAQPNDGAATRVPANDRIGLAVIGLHGRGIEHLDSFTYDDGAEIVALCDVDENTFAKAQAKLQERGRPQARQYTDIRKLLEDKDVNAVSIAVPNHWHALAGIWAMQAGKDAYVEKPVSHNISEGRRLEEARVKYNRICQAGLQARTSPAHRQGIQYIQEGKIGKVLLARGLCYKRRKSIGHFEDSPVPQGVHYDLWLGPAPLRPFNKNRFHYEWHWNWDYGDGDLGNQGVHQMDVARWALGKAQPTNAIALGGRFGYEDDGQTPNTQVACFDYGDAQLLFEVRGLETPPAVADLGVGTIVYGTEGFVAFPNEDAGAATAFDNKWTVVQKFKGRGNHFSNFLKAVRTRSQSDLNCPILEGHLSTTLCHLANISYRLGAPHPFGVRAAELSEAIDLHDAFGRFEQHLADSAIKLRETTYQLGPRLAFRPQDESFADNPKANQMLTREYREPFFVPSRI
jgi:predicted dehydrogenase